MFQLNIDFRGRAWRALAGLGFAIVSGSAWQHSHIAAGVCGVTAAFLLFEAARGWCAARSCKIKTPF